MTDYSRMTDEELSAAMDALDATRADGLRTNPQARGTPHNEHFKRSVFKTFWHAFHDKAAEDA